MFLFKKSKAEKERKAKLVAERKAAEEKAARKLAKKAAKKEAKKKEAAAAQNSTTEPKKDQAHKSVETPVPVKKTEGASASQVKKEEARSSLKKRLSLKKANEPPVYNEFEVMMDEYIQGLRELYPEHATMMGFHENDDKLSDATVEQHLEIAKVMTELLERLDAKFANHKFKGWTLDQKTSFLVFRDTLEARISYVENKEYYLGLSTLSSPHTDLPLVMSSHNFETAQDWKIFQKRLLQIPRYIDQTIETLERGLEENIAQSKPVLESFPKQMKEMISAEVNPFQRIVNEEWKDSLPAELRAEVEATIDDTVMPAFKKFGEFMADFVTKLSDEPALPKRVTNGDKMYQNMLERHTTTTMTPKEVHDLGLAEVARITAAMEAIAKKEGFEGPNAVDEFQAKLDETHFCKTEEDLIQHYQVVAMNISPQLPKLFGKLPRTPFGIKPIPAYAAPNGPGAYYNPPPLDLSRPGWFSLNTSFLPTRKTYVAECLVAHEALPGHHLQVALSTENQNLHAFRRATYHTAYVEGWGLYSECLGFELGLYKTSASLFGRYQGEILRACRLVVDTGMNYFGWSKQKAMDYMLEHRAGTFEECDSETSRYLGLPGQALAYKIGEIKFRELRAMAEEKLGSKFDIRDFHDLVIGVGSVGLSTLEKIVSEWIEEVLTSKE